MRDLTSTLILKAEVSNFSTQADFQIQVSICNIPITHGCVYMHVTPTEVNQACSRGLVFSICVAYSLSLLIDKQTVRHLQLCFPHTKGEAEWKVKN